MLEKYIFDLMRSRSLDWKIGKCMMDLADLLIEMDDFGHEVASLDILGRILHSEFKPALQFPVLVQLEDGHNGCGKRLDRCGSVEVLGALQF